MPEHAERAELAREFARRQRPVLEPLPDVRAQPVVRELADGVAQQAVLVVEVLVEVEQVQPRKCIAHAADVTARTPAVPRFGARITNLHPWRTNRRWPSIRSRAPVSCGSRTGRTSRPDVYDVDARGHVGHARAPDPDRRAGRASAPVRHHVQQVRGARTAHVLARQRSLPLSKIGERLQVHATSVTNVIDRLEAAGLVRRAPRTRATAAARSPCSPPRDAPSRRRRPPTSTPRASALARARPAASLKELFDVLRRLRTDAGDLRRVT